jgi:hypothetical protein
LQPSSQHRLPISDLSGGVAQRRRDEFWIGMKFSASAVTGIPFDQIQDNQIEELMKYQGNTDARMQRLGLDRAMYNWSVWPDIEDNIHQNLLTKIRGLFSSELFTEIMIESGLTYKALRAIKAIDEYGIFSNVTSTNICKHLKVRP